LLLKRVEPYRLQFTPNLSQDAWSDAVGDVAASGTNATKLDATAGGTTNRL